MVKYQTTATVRVVLNLMVDATVYEHDDEDDVIHNAVFRKLAMGIDPNKDTDIEITGKSEPKFDV